MSQVANTQHGVTAHAHPILDAVQLDAKQPLWCGAWHLVLLNQGFSDTSDCI